VASIAANAEHT
jgi:hypothetical protein